MAAMQSARSEIAKINAELLIKKALKSRLPPATKFQLEPGNTFAYTGSEAADGMDPSRSRGYLLRRCG